MATKTGILGDTTQTDSSDDPISRQVINAVAEAKGVDPLDLDPLYDTIDPDALDVLFGDTESSLSKTELRFKFEGCEVVIRGRDEVSVMPSPDGVVTSAVEVQNDQHTTRDAVEERCGIEFGATARLESYYA